MEICFIALHLSQFVPISLSLTPRFWECTTRTVTGIRVATGQKLMNDAFNRGAFEGVGV